MRESHAFILLTPPRVRKTVGGLAVLCVIVLAGAGAFWEFYWSLEVPWEEAPRIKHALVHFNLATENVPAVWFSSMLFLLVAVVSVICFAADVYEAPQFRAPRALKYGWLLFALVFIALSLDEMGSIHERVSTILASHGLFRIGGGWTTTLFMFILAVALFMTAFGWFHVRRVRGTFALMMVGVACFLSIPLQEYVEIDVMYRAAGEGWQRPTALLLLEEGTEMLGALSFLAAVLLYAKKVSQRHTEPGEEVQHVVAWFPSPKAAVAVALAFVLLMGLAMEGVQTVMGNIEGDIGIPRNWFPSALAMFVALLGLHLWNTTRRGQHSGALLYLTLVVISVVASMYVGGYLYAYTSWGAFDTFRLVSESVSIVIIFVTGLLLARRVGSAWSRAGVAGWALCLGAAIGPAGFFLVVPLVFIAFALLLPSLLTHKDLWLQPVSRLAKA